MESTDTVKDTEQNMDTTEDKTESSSPDTTTAAKEAKNGDATKETETSAEATSASTDTAAMASESTKTNTDDTKPETKETENPDVKQDSPDENAESDEESEDDEPTVALFNADPIISGKRQRTTTDRLSTYQPEAKKVKKQPEGKGTPLGQIAMIEEQIKKHKADDLHDLHRLCFGAKGSRLEVRKHLRLFKGFDFESNPTVKDKTQSALEKRHMPALRTICDIICISHTGDKETLMDNIMDFLNKPNESACIAEKKAKAKKAKASAKKKKKVSKKAAKADKPKRAPSAYNLFIKENRQKAVEKYPDAKNTEIIGKMSEMWKECSSEEKAKYTKMAEDAKAAIGDTSAKKPAKTSAKSSAKKQKAAESSEDDESEEDDDEDDDSDDDKPIANEAKTEPTVNDIKKEIRKIVKRVGADITFGQVRKGLTVAFPTLDITARKAELKKMATTILQG